MIKTVIHQISLLQFKGAATRHEHFISQEFELSVTDQATKFRFYFKQVRPHKTTSPSVNLTERPKEIAANAVHIRTELTVIY